MKNIKCDCGREIHFYQRYYLDPTYFGECNCGAEYILVNGKKIKQNTTKTIFGL